MMGEKMACSMYELDGQSTGNQGSKSRHPDIAATGSRIVVMTRLQLSQCAIFWSQATPCCDSTIIVH